MASVHQLKITLNGIRPPIWRRIQIPSSATLAQLHEVICGAFGWHGGHLHEFDAGGVQYGEPDPENDFDVADERRMTLRRLAPGAGGSFDYLYDFGDSWDHRILVEKVLDVRPSLHHAVCLGGRRAGPPDDCGGVWGYQELLEVLGDPSHPEYAERVEWVGGEIDPDEFSAREVTDRLKHVPISAGKADENQ